jgi:hypothetical protein
MMDVLESSSRWDCYDCFVLEGSARKGGAREGGQEVGHVVPGTVNSLGSLSMRWPPSPLPKWSRRNLCLQKTNNSCRPLLITNNQTFSCVQ